MSRGKRAASARRPPAPADAPALAELRPGRRRAGQLATAGRPHAVEDERQVPVPQLGRARGVGIAGIGAIFFALADGPGRHVPVYLHAAQWTALATVGLLACAFAVAFGLPRRAREV